MKRRFALGLIFALLAGLFARAGASTPSLGTTAYGALDFGDGIIYHLASADCEASVHVAVVAAGNEVDGPSSHASPDIVNPDLCVGLAHVPTFDAVSFTGWRQGQPISFMLTSSTGDAVPLRYARIEADQATTAAGAPTVVDANDPDTGAWDKAMSMSQGDAINLGRVDLSHVEAFSLRMCLTIGVGQSTPADPVEEERHEIQTYMSIHQGSPSGPAIVQTVDVAADPFTDDRLNTHGFGHGCWHLVTLPVTGATIATAPELFVVYDAGVEPVILNSVDIDGTGAKVAALPQQDPPGTETIFDGTSFDGWTQSNCVLDEGAIRSADASVALSGCSLTYKRPVHNVILRFDLRRESFYDNNEMLMPHEIQGRSAGEYGPGGYFGEDAARWEKFNMWPDWSEIEIVQLGARYVVTLNGRTVTDHVASSGDPTPFQIQLANQPEWSWQYGVQGGFGDMNPTAEPLTSWGRFWYRNIRLYECASATDPICVAEADARPGEVPQA